MADRKPLKVLPDSASGTGGGDSTGIGEFVEADTLGVVDGGTGLATVATSNILTGNGANALSAESSLTFDGSTLTVAGDQHITNGNGLIMGHTARVQVGWTTGENQILGTDDADANLSITRYSNDNGPPNLFLGKSRGALGAQAIVADGDPLGRISFAGSDGVDMRSVGAWIEAECDGEFEADNISGRIIFATTPDSAGVQDPTERMRIASTGKLTLTTNTAEGDYLAHFINDGNVNNKQGMKLQAGADDGSGETVYFLAQDGDGGNLGSLIHTSGTFQLVDYSDERGKENIVDTAVDGLATINAIEVKDFTRKKSGEQVIAGFTAQQMLTAYPSAVHQSEDVPDVLYAEDVAAVLYEEGDDLPEGKSVGDVKTEAIKKGDVKIEGYPNSLALGKDSLIGPLVKAVQQLSAKVIALESA